MLPLYDNRPSYAYCVLETLEIVCCGDLKDVFRVYDNNQELLVATKEFSELKHIHLHELPSLQRICGHRIVAPKLETIKIRGCWSLTRLPAVGLDSTRKPKVDCEKEWWDGLQWDGLEKGHHPSLYELTHSRYYKKKLPRGSMLRYVCMSVCIHDCYMGFIPCTHIHTYIETHKAHYFTCSIMYIYDRSFSFFLILSDLACFLFLLILGDRYIRPYTTYLIQ